MGDEVGMGRRGGNQRCAAEEGAEDGLRLQEDMDGWLIAGGFTLQFDKTWRRMKFLTGLPGVRV
jgi:hypothetical protein